MERLFQILPAIKNRGIIKALLVGLYSILDYGWDIWYGTDTMGMVELEELEIHSKNKEYGVMYQPTNARLFKKIMSVIRFPENSVFVDFGAGKGRVLLLAAQYPFRRITGVEFSGELVNICRQNIVQHRKRVNGNKEISIIHSDAVDYSIENDANVFFFFNPFTEEVMVKVLENIYCSFKMSNREIFIIYHKPESASVFNQCSWLKLYARHVLKGNDVYIYKSLWKDHNSGE